MLQSARLSLLRSWKTHSQEFLEHSQTKALCYVKKVTTMSKTGGKKQGLEDLVAQHQNFLSVLASAPERKARTLIRAAPVPTLRFLGDIAYNLQKGRFPLTPAQRQYFKNRKKILKQIGDPYIYTAKQRRETLKQRGGNLSTALSRLVLSAIKYPSQDHIAAAQEEEEVGK